MEENSEDDEDNLGAIGFMFDAEHDKETHDYAFATDINIHLKLISETPGHLQSGQYLWPAAKAAADHLIRFWDSNLRSSCVLELGAGCGLTGLVVKTLQKRDVDGEGDDDDSVVVFTDYDPGSLTLISDNIKANFKDKSTQSSCPVHYLAWGKPLELSEEEKLSNKYPSDGYPLIVGTDLLYCCDVIRPLFTTIKSLLAINGTFLLVTSFKLQEAMEQEIENSCKLFAIKREVQVLLDEDAGVSRIEYYRFE